MRGPGLRGIQIEMFQIGLQYLCIGSAVDSLAALGDSLIIRSIRLSDGSIRGVLSKFEYEQLLFHVHVFRVGLVSRSRSFS